MGKQLHTSKIVRASKTKHLKGKQIMGNFIFSLHLFADYEYIKNIFSYVQPGFIFRKEDLNDFNTEKETFNISNYSSGLEFVLATKTWKTISRNTQVRFVVVKT